MLNCVLIQALARYMAAYSVGFFRRIAIWLGRVIGFDRTASFPRCFLHSRCSTVCVIIFFLFSVLLSIFTIEKFHWRGLVNRVLNVTTPLSYLWNSLLCLWQACMWSLYLCRHVSDFNVPLKQLWTWLFRKDGEQHVCVSREHSVRFVAADEWTKERKKYN
jgi:hypothetical protein